MCSVLSLEILSFNQTANYSYWIHLEKHSLVGLKLSSEAGWMSTIQISYGNDYCYKP